MRDGWRLAAGTLTALPTRPPGRVDAAVARTCVLLAPVAVAPLALAVAIVGSLGLGVGLPTFVTAFLALGALALGTRVLHWDGLSDTVDGLTASYDRERSLQVMKSGTSGPAGVVATVVVLGAQAAALATLFTTWHGVALGALAVAVSRASLALTCRTGVPPARKDGLGHPLSSVAPTAAGAALWTLCAALLAAASHWAGAPWWQGVLASLTAVTVVLLLVRHATKRLGGVTGDVYGAGVELALMSLLVALSA